MKKIMLLLITVGFLQATMAQQPQNSFATNPYPKTISVNGSAEMEIVPDEIFVNVVLTEYQKRGETKKDIETIKTEFLESCKGIGIPDSFISIVFYSGYNSSSYYNIRKRKKNSDVYANITYQVKFKTSKLMDDLVEKLDDNATQNFQIVSTSHSKIADYRRQLKIKALQAAKEKGIYLSEAVGEKIGDAITINEPGEGQSFYMDPTAMSNNVYLSYGFAARDSVNVPQRPDVDFKKIKLRFEVSVVFALK